MGTSDIGTIHAPHARQWDFSPRQRITRLSKAMDFDARPRPPSAPFDRTLRHSTINDSERHASSLALKTCERFLLAAQERAAEEHRRANAACASTATLQLAIRELEAMLDREREAHESTVRAVRAELAEEQAHRHEQHVSYDALVAELRGTQKTLERALTDGRERHALALKAEQTKSREERERHQAVIRASQVRLDRSLRLQAERHATHLADRQRRSLAMLEAVRQAYAELRAQAGAAVQIAANGRGQAARKQYAAQRKAAICFQACARRFIAQRLLRRKVQERRVASIAAQAAGRRHIARLAFRAKREAATSVQAAGRRHFARTQLEQQRAAACRVQAAERRRSARREYEGTRAAVIRVQTVGRGWRQRRDLEAQQLAAERLQAVWKGHSDRRLLTEYLAEEARIDAEREREAKLRELMVHYA